MKRVIVIGSGGAGKSTLAREIGSILDLPVIHLDREHWRPNWTEPPKDEWRRRVVELVSGDRWVIDGNFGGTMDIRMAACDTVVFLDFPRLTCTYRVIKRRLTYHNRSRPDMGEGCNEKLDLEFLSWVWNFSKRSKLALEERLKDLGAGKAIIRLRTPKEVRRFVARLRGPDPRGDN